jgi:hypothetical protein
VGSGKTTELLDVQSRLNRVGDTRALYLDVTRQHDIAKIVPGVVAVQVGLALGAELEPLAAEGRQKGLAKAYLGTLRGLADGFEYEPEYEYGYLDDTVRAPGILVRPGDDLDKKVIEAIEPIKELCTMLRETWQHIVVLLDGLDRLIDMAAFEQLVVHDINALASMRIGLVLVGPLRSMYGMDRTVEQYFDRMHYQPWLDIASSPEAVRFLNEVVRRRLPDGVMAEMAIGLLAGASGGVIRDLIALAQLACLEAYLDGSEQIGPVQAESAIDTFGRKHMQGLRAGEIEVLQRVRSKGIFLHTSEDDLALLMTRRVLEYRSQGRLRYAVHPTIVRFLADMAGHEA